MDHYSVRLGNLPELGSSWLNPSWGLATPNFGIVKLQILVTAKLALAANIGTAT